MIVLTTVFGNTQDRDMFLESVLYVYDVLPRSNHMKKVRKKQNCNSQGGPIYHSSPVLNAPIIAASYVNANLERSHLYLRT